MSLPATYLKIFKTGACLPWCSISFFSKQFEDVWASRLWVSGVLEFGPILAWKRFPAAEEFVVVFDVFFCLMIHQMFSMGERSGLQALFYYEAMLL